MTGHLRTVDHDCIQPRGSLVGGREADAPNHELVLSVKRGSPTLRINPSPHESPAEGFQETVALWSCQRRRGILLVLLV